MIKKEGSKYVVRTESGRRMGSYSTRSQATERLRQIEAAKYAKGKK